MKLRALFQIGAFLFLGALLEFLAASSHPLVAFLATPVVGLLFLAADSALEWSSGRLWIIAVCPGMACLLGVLLHWMAHGAQDCFSPGKLERGPVRVGQPALVRPAIVPVPSLPPRGLRGELLGFRPLLLRCLRSEPGARLSRRRPMVGARVWSARPIRALSLVQSAGR